MTNGPHLLDVTRGGPSIRSAHRLTRVAGQDAIAVYSLLPNGPYLIAVTLGAIALLLILILAVRMHAFLALFLSAMALGVAAGMPPLKLLKSMQAGVGDALGFIAVVIGL